MKKSVSTFWVNWIIVVSAISALLGLFLSFTPYVQQFLGPIYYNSFFTSDAYATLSPEAVQFHRFMFGLSGAVLTSWLLSVVAIAHIPFRRGERWAWWIILITLLAWFAGDSYTSLVTGFVVHAFLNLSLLIALGIPLAFTYSSFKE